MGINEKKTILQTCCPLFVPEIWGNPRTISNLNCLFSMHNWKWVNLSKMAGFNISLSLKGQCPDYAHARASSVFSSKDNRTVILTQQDFLPDRTADGDLLFIFSSNISDFRRSLSSYLKFGLRHEDSSRFFASGAASRPENLFPLAWKQIFYCETRVRGQLFQVQ